MLSFSFRKRTKLLCKHLKNHIDDDYLLMNGVINTVNIQKLNSYLVSFKTHNDWDIGLILRKVDALVTQQKICSTENVLSQYCRSELNAFFFIAAIYNG